MNKRLWILLLIAPLLNLPAAGQPAGYEIVEVTNWPGREFNPTLNNNGQIVFTAEFGPQSTWEIFLYDGNTGEITRITDDNVPDTLPFINDAGTIAWTRKNGAGGTTEVMIRYANGKVVQLTHNDVFELVLDLNNLDQLVFNRENTRGCVGLGEHVMFFDGRSIRQITNNEWFNTSISLSDRGDIVWAEFDICAGGVNWRSLIKLYSKGVITTLSEPGLQAQYTTINNNGVCAWMFFDPAAWQEGIQVWDNGVRTLLTDWGDQPNLNDRGELAFGRWHDNTSTWQVWCHTKGRFSQITADPFSNIQPVINNAGEITWMAGTFPDEDIRLLRRLPRGDLNCDGALDGADIDPFFLALGRPMAYQSAFPNCDPLLGDMNGDGALNGADIDPFFAALGGG